MYKRLRDLREDRDMTQKQVAEILGMSQTGYSKYETGENDIPTQILIKLSKLYGTTIDYLLNQTDQKYWRSHRVWEGCKGSGTSYLFALLFCQEDEQPCLKPKI